MWITTCFVDRKITLFYQFLHNIFFYKRSPTTNLSTTSLREVPGSTIGKRRTDRPRAEVVEGYPPDESLQWDETTHMISP